MVNLHAKYAQEGFDIVAFPTDEFGGQELRTNQEIKDFVARCLTRDVNARPKAESLLSEHPLPNCANIDQLWRLRKLDSLARFIPPLVPPSNNSLLSHGRFLSWTIIA